MAKYSSDYSIWHDLVEYDESSLSFLVWKVDRFSGRYMNVKHISIGDRAGCLNPSCGYYCIGLGKKPRRVYMNSRIVWTILVGEIPAGFEVDHIDGNRVNNCIDNLRCVSQKVNRRNANKAKNNTSGVTGVCSQIERGVVVYVAYWSSDGVRQKSKRFSVAAYGDAAFQLACEYREKMIETINAQGAGYTERHGL